MRKVVFHLNTLGQGGAERVVSTLANQLSKIGYQVYVATEWFSQDEFVLSDQVTRVDVGLTPKQMKAGRVRQFFFRIKNLKELVKREQPDVIIAFGQKAIYRALMATYSSKIPVITAVRTDPKLNYSGKADKLLIPLLWRRAAGNVFQTIGARDFFPKKVREKSVIILNPIADKYLGSEQPLQRRKAVVNTGRLVEGKNQVMLIRAFRLVWEKHPDYYLEIYGEDSKDGTKEKINNCIADCKAADYVKLMGSCSELEKVMWDASIYAFASNGEGLPNAVMEAMALGLPVVSTDCPCGGPATLIKNGFNGLLVPVNEEKEMAKAINYLIEHPDTRKQIGERAVEISKMANPDRICEQWKEYIERVCREAGK